MKANVRRKQCFRSSGSCDVEPRIIVPGRLSLVMGDLTRGCREGRAGSRKLVYCHSVWLDL
jgi:hypothetical protein